MIKKLCHSHNKFKTSIKSWINFGKRHRVITFNQKDQLNPNQKDQLNPYVDMNTELQQKAKNNFQKDFFKLMNNAIFGKTRENVKKIETINLSQKKEEEMIYYQDQIIIQNFPKKIYQQQK